MRKVRVVLENCRPSDRFDVIDRCREADRAGNVRRATLEPVRSLLVRALLWREAYDSFACALRRRRGIQKLSASVKHADASRSTHFVSGKCKEIAAQLLHIDRHVSGTLRCIDQRHRAYRASSSAKFGYGINCAQRVR